MSMCQKLAASSCCYSLELSSSSVKAAIPLRFGGRSKISLVGRAERHGNDYE